jgi:cell division protein FtsN
MKWAGLVLGVALAAAGCSRQQGDWDKARTANNLESYEQFVKKYPNGDFTAQAQARIKELEEERDWQKARDADTPDAYQAFLKQYPEGKWTEEARIRIENFSLAQTPAGAVPGAEGGAPPAAADGSSPGAVNPALADAGQGAAAPAAAAKPAAVEKPVPAEKPAKTRSAAEKPAAHAADAGGNYAVQLGAFSAGKSAAEHGWTKLVAAHSSLKGLKHRVVAGKGPSGPLFRLQAIQLSKAHAESLCAGLKAKKQSCMVIAP